MALIPPSAEKHDLDGIAAASAAAIMAVLAANPATAWLTVGFIGKIVFWLLTLIFKYLSSMGLVILNVGAERLSVVIDRVEYDGTIDSAYKLMDEIRATGKDLTPEQEKAIDDQVIVAFRKFAKIGRVKS